MIKTLKMGVRDSSLPYINSSNELVGTCDALEMFFCQDSISIDGSFSTLTSPVNSYSVTMASAGVVQTTNRFSMNAANFSWDTGATGFTIGTTDDALVVASGEAYTGTGSLIFRLVGATGSALGLATNSSNSTLTIIDDTPTTVTCAAIGSSTAGQTYTCYTILDHSSATGVSRERNQTTAASIATPTTANATSLTTTMTFDQSDTITFRGDFAAVGVFLFPAGTLPSNAQAMARWMGAQWAAGNYVLPKGW